MLLFLNYPSWIKPEIIPGVPFLRWYGLMYLFAFAAAFFAFRYQVKNGELEKFSGMKVSDDDVLRFFTWGIVGLLLGARIFAALVYDTSGIYLRRPWLIFWPFRDGQWTGLAGMSYHGGFIGGCLGMILWCVRYRKPFAAWCDCMTASIPLGYTFGRLGNFLNGELYGRVTESPLGMFFPSARRFPLSEEWVQEFAARNGTPVPLGAATVNLPRHPSQLYEALFEGLVLWALLWFVFRKRKPWNGFISAMYTLGYGLFRFVIEYFREPDSNLGFRITRGEADAPTYLLESLLNISTGQILCLLMILGSAGFLAGYPLYRKKKNGVQ